MMTSTERARKLKQRRKDAGLVRHEFWLPPEAVRAAEYRELRQIENDCLRAVKKH